jgi:hypothetical protein
VGNGNNALAVGRPNVTISVTGSGTFDLIITPNGAAPVPEPTSLVLLTLVASGFAGRAWRKRRANVHG